MASLFVLFVCPQFDFVLKMISCFHVAQAQHVESQRNHICFYSKVDESVDGS